jgi:hypothetical protein
MKKAKAIELLGGSPSKAAAMCEISVSAVSQWPDELTRDIENRVLAALARQHLPAHLIGAPEPASVAVI